jgi:hypothetical protein
MFLSPANRDRAVDQQYPSPVHNFSQLISRFSLAIGGKTVFPAIGAKQVDDLRNILTQEQYEKQNM